MGWLLIASEPGRHGFNVVGPFETQTAAETWRDERQLEGFAKPLTDPADWKPNDGRYDS